jgi:hypothetical protein
MQVVRMYNSRCHMLAPLVVIETVDAAGKVRGVHGMSIAEAIELELIKP